MDEVEIRRATAADKDDILNIADVYNGADYLKDFFDEIFINCDQTTPYVAVYNTEIIGFIAAFHVDDGQTVISRAARVKPQFAGQGVFKMLTQHLLKHSSAKTHVFTVLSTDAPFNSSSLWKEHKLNLSMPLIMYDFNVSDLNVADEQKLNTDSLSLLTKDHLQTFFTEETYKNYLFPGDRVMIEWVPFQLLPSNIPIIWMRETHSLRISDVRCENGEVKGLMSISTAFYGPKYVYHIVLYGTDVSSLRYHIVSHVQFICKHGVGEAILNVPCSAGIEATCLHTCLEEFGFKTQRVESSACVFEKEIYRADCVV